MKLNIGYTSDDKRKLDKKFTKLHKNVKANINYPCSYVDPVFIVASSLVESNTNYVWCDDFNRYYFVNDIIQKGDIAEIHCHVDVLMSYAGQISNLKTNIARCEQSGEYGYNPLFADEKILTTVKRRLHFYDCGTTPFSTTGSGQPVVLTVSGGVS